MLSFHEYSIVDLAISVEPRSIRGAEAMRSVTSAPLFEALEVSYIYVSWTHFKYTYDGCREDPQRRLRYR
jgi:hypothetical protein